MHLLCCCIFHFQEGYRLHHAHSKSGLVCVRVTCFTVVRTKMQNHAAGLRIACRLHSLQMENMHCVYIANLIEMTKDGRNLEQTWTLKQSLKERFQKSRADQKRQNYRSMWTTFKFKHTAIVKCLDLFLALPADS